MDGLQPTIAKCVMDGAPVLLWRSDEEQGQQQIPCGDDNKKAKTKSGQQQRKGTAKGRAAEKATAEATATQALLDG
jgi:hypothetical protein